MPSESIGGIILDIAHIIGRRLFALREESGFTQEDIQRLTGINRTTYSKNESGKAAPSLSNLHTFARIYGVSLDYLCDINDRSKLKLYDSGKSMTKEEKMLVSFFRLLSEEEQKEYLEKIEIKAAQSRTDTTEK